ncbi:MAG: hypothetical protein KME18_25690 [Phormidium tanganyikae FI6-MK23]|jgi:hypothetical protein|nr:hypothetical protein [Phormidium tanganyikae FI6-MK23]
MRLLKHFDTFLKDIVNLNQGRIDRLEGHVEAIQDFLECSDYSPDIIRFSPQGSWAHKSIIKPRSNKEFDADLVMFVEQFEKWSPKDYVNNLYSVFRQSERYQEKVSRATRCVVLDYSSDFHLDVVPCIVDSDDESIFNVCNRNKDTFEETAPEAYSDWLSERNTWTGKNMLRYSIRLLKYLRDIKATFSVKSILLTTLVGNCVDDSDQSVQEELFLDLPTSLKTLTGRLDDYLQTNFIMPVVRNPVLSTETFNRHWDQEKYENFRDCIHRYREWIDDAYDEEDKNESIRKWRRVFGDEFAKGEVKAAATFSESTSLIALTGCRDVVSAVLAKGAYFLDSWISPKLPHVEKLRWPIRKGPGISVRIAASEYTDRYASQSVRILESGKVVEKGRWIRFEARNALGLRYTSLDFEVKWQVVNTDIAAVQADQLRGDFYQSSDSGIRWESTSYHGAHWVEAFIISRREGRCWGRSGRFFIVVN